MRNKDSLRSVLLYLTLLLILIKFVLLPVREKFKTEKSIYEDYLQAYYQKSFISYRVAPKENNSSEKDTSTIYSRDRDPLELQLLLGEKVKNLAQKKGIDLNNLEFPPFTSDKSLTSIPVSLQFKAKAKDAISFLKSLEAENKEIYYREVSITPEGLNLNVKLTIEVFRSEV